ncbi:hypothetical protein O9H85_05510 [Paenibacillus filicis]|uniref:Uncharacterized protein n=1 Tax=Paenibacillus gyeongsangnamensis TaxID=3388067 RepID=A0ABT4Q4S9_9BACL|nr:hypothetical protein [Paenibacillus filicis]MCZ8511887.1 hypothetical protein [Paenibacillus filicis]
MTAPSVHPPALPVYPESYWLASTSLPSFPRLTRNIHADVDIVGAGITGITTHPKVRYYRTEVHYSPKHGRPPGFSESRFVTKEPGFTSGVSAAKYRSVSRRVARCNELPRPL